MSSPYRSFRTPCLGRILHFLYYYCGSRVAESVEVHSDAIWYMSEKIATYEVLPDTDIYHFNFLHGRFATPDIVKCREENQKSLIFKVLRDQGPLPACKGCAEKDRLLALQKALHDGSLFTTQGRWEAFKGRLKVTLQGLTGHDLYEATFGRNTNNQVFWDITYQNQRSVLCSERVLVDPDQDPYSTEVHDKIVMTVLGAKSV